MRMWLGVDPAEMCRKHLLGEHVEIHMLAGCILRGKSIKGFIEKRLVCAYRARERHTQISREMNRRGYNHSSTLPDAFFADDLLDGTTTLLLSDVVIAREANRLDLAARCPDCAARMGVSHNAHQEAIPANPDHVPTQEDIDLQQRADLALAEFLKDTEGGQ